MKQKHYKGLLSAFVNHELPRDEQEEIARHLLQCANCRTEHDALKLGSSFAARLESSDAPVHVWSRIEDALDGTRATQMTLIPEGTFFGFRNLAGYAVGIAVVAGFISIAYFTMFRTRPDVARHDPETPIHIQNGQSAANTFPVNLPVNADQANTNSVTANSNAVIPPAGQTPEIASSSWQFETISGAPKVGTASGADRLAVGDFLETDGLSRARISVANIGTVEIEPNSRVKLVGTDRTQHRISLERGTLQAQIAAPPRLFIVDTPSAVAVDLGCEYKLEVDKAGNSYLHVTKGFVALERGGRESIVPAGAYCLTKRGQGLGTPFSADTTDGFKAALKRFDFGNGGSGAVDEMLKLRSFSDMITLWHLLSRVKRTDREKVFNALSEYVKPPSDVTLQGIRALDKKMLSAWRSEVERAWFE